jgi:hypothetical protein
MYVLITGRVFLQILLILLNLYVFKMQVRITCSIENAKPDVLYSFIKKPLTYF